MNRRYSLRRNKEFRYVYNTGRSVSSKYIVLIYKPRKTVGLKVGFSVSKKIGKSVVRNKVKRRLKHAFASLLPNTDGRSLLVFVAKPSILECDYKEIQANVMYLLKKAGIYMNGDHH